MPTPADRILIWGAGGHGKVIADLVRAIGYDLVGFIDVDPAKASTLAEPGGGRVVLRQDEFLDVVRSTRRLPFDARAIAVAIGDNVKRLRYVLELGTEDCPPLVHPSAVVSPSATLGAGVVVLANAVVNAAATVGIAAIVNTGAVVEHECRIGAGAHVSPHATVTGGARLGDCAWIGAGATVLPGITVGENSRVGAGAVVLHHVTPGAVVVGVPARPLSEGHSA